MLRSITLFLSLVAALAMVIFVHAKTNSSALPEISVIRTPDDGIQPQTALDSRGVLHMIYFKGDPSAGDVEYVRREPGAKDFSTPIRVNSQPSSAVAIGTVRGPQMALGRNDRAYVAWFGSSQAVPSGPDGATPVLFSRLNDSATAFEPQRNLMRFAKGVNGGFSVAADRKGSVYVVWHATGKIEGEANRLVYLTRSTDDGATFAPEVPISPTALGACGCCGMRSFVDDGGALYVLYRAATESIHRDMTLLVSTDHGRTFRAARLAPWDLNACPMSTSYLSEGRHGVLAAWETAGQVYFAEINAGTLSLPPFMAAPGEAGARNHPAVALNFRGQVLLAWTEGTAWSKGGALAWQLFDGAGRPIASEGHAPGVPVWGLPSVFTNGKGNFTIVY